MSEVYHNTNELQPSSSIMDQNDPWSAYDAVVEEEEKEFYRGNFPVLLNKSTGKCFVPKRDYQRNRKDEKWRWLQAEWIMKQIVEENVDSYHFEHENWWKTVKQKYRRQGVRYRSFPQPNGVVVLVSKVGETKLPLEETECIELIEDWLSRIPDDKQIGGNRDFGGEYKGLKPKSDGKFLVIRSHLWKVTSIAKRDDMLEWEKPEEKVIALKLEKNETPKEIAESLKKIEEWARKQFT